MNILIIGSGGREHALAWRCAQDNFVKNVFVCPGNAGTYLENKVSNVMASDAFFPFRDGIDKAASSGITAIIQPGGSIKDDEVIAAANEHGIAMVFTGMRHFRH